MPRERGRERERTPVGEILWYSDFRISICIHLFYSVSFRSVSFLLAHSVSACPTQSDSQLQPLEAASKKGFQSGEEKEGELLAMHTKFIL